MESDDNMLLPSAICKPSHASTPKPNKRCAPEPMMNLESASNSSSKKRLQLDCDATLLASPRTYLSTSTLSTPGRMVSTGARVNITRGIQTIRPETVNRYCQVSVARIRKPTATIHVQTEACLPPPAVVTNEIGCQTDGPILPKTCVGITQTTEALASRPVERFDDASCQTDTVEEQQQEQQERQEPELEQSEKNGSALESITTMLNDFAKQYGIDLQSPAKKKKPKFGSKKKEIEHLQECLAKKTYKAMASKVNEKMGKLLEKHITEYGRETVASRERLIRWTKSFIRRQQQRSRAATNAPSSSRKIVLVRKVVRVPNRPSVEEKSVQCVPGLLGTGRITVGTQWQRQKPMVTKKKPAPSHSITTRSKANSTTKPPSTDSKPCSAGATQSLRQTKLSSYAKDQDGGKTIQGRQPRQRKQQGECSPKPSKSAAVTVKPLPSSSKTTKTPAPSPVRPAPAANKKKRNEKKASKESMAEICIEETPSPSPSPPPPPQRSKHVLERKHFPYRSPPTYPSQCSKATETSFLSPSRIRNLAPELLMDHDRQPLNYHFEANDNRSFNPGVLLSPLERMYMEPTTAATTATTAPTNRSEYKTFLIPLRTNESVPPTPQRIMYLNPPERRVLLRSGSSNGGLVREKPPEISIISSQQLYSQIGLAVEKALKNQTLPSLATMYGEPFIEKFNVCGQVPPGRDQRNSEQAKKEQPARVNDKFVCSSGKEDPNLHESQQNIGRPPFHTERSPSLSPIVYADENSGDEMTL